MSGQLHSWPADEQQAKDALELTTRWAVRCKTQWDAMPDRQNSLFGIVQGGMFKHLREESADALTALDFPGYALGGLSVGEPKDLMMAMAEHSLPPAAGKSPSTSWAWAPPKIWWNWSPWARTCSTA
ncbi:MAG: tRNA-guanine transglycosylase [Desulfobacterales bacterium]